MLVHLLEIDFEQQLGCRFDTMDSISSFFCILTYAIIYVLIHHIIVWLYLYFLFFKYSCTNIFHRRSLCTFYSDMFVILYCDFARCLLIFSVLPDMIEMRIDYMCADLVPYFRVKLLILLRSHWTAGFGIYHRGQETTRWTLYSNATE